MYVYVYVSIYQMTLVLSTDSFARYHLMHTGADLCCCCKGCGGPFERLPPASCPFGTSKQPPLLNLALPTVSLTVLAFTPCVLRMSCVRVAWLSSFCLHCPALSVSPCICPPQTSTLSRFVYSSTGFSWLAGDSFFILKNK